jgi:hypothetical protein
MTSSRFVRLGLCLLSALLGCGIAPAVAQAPQLAAPQPVPTAAAADSPYSQLVDRLKTGDRTVDFTELRMAFTDTPAYTGTMMALYRPLWNTLNSRDFDGALKVVETVLQRNYAEPNAHMVASIAHGQLGRQQESQFHRFIADGLLRSIMAQGDGKTEQTAYHVIDISEEYAVFRALNLTPKGQGASAPKEGEPILDRMTVVDNQTKEERTMYFAVENKQSLAKKRAAAPQ